MQNKSAKLNLFSLTMLVIGFVIGMGIFRTAATSAKDAISPSVYFSAWAIGGLVALCGALTYAEIGSRYPVTGGYYKVFAKAYHPSIAFAINCIILVSNAASISGVALIGRVATTLAALEAEARAGRPIMDASIACALARVTTGEWAAALRSVWGEYRAATGIGGASIAGGVDGWDALRARVAALPRRPKLLVGKPGLDGHSNGAEVIAVAARDAGFEVIYAGIRLDPAAIAAAAVQEDVDVIGLSVLSGSHLELTRAVLAELAERGAGDMPVVVGGTVPKSDHAELARLGVKRVFTPADYRLVDIVGALVDLCGVR